MSLKLAPGAAEELEDRYVEKVVTSWLEQAVVDTKTFNAQHDAMCAQMSKFSPVIGNPAGQQKFFRHVCKGFGNHLLFARLLPGKRKRFLITLDFATAKDPDISPSGRPTTWIAVTRRVVGCKGVNQPPTAGSYVVAWFTRHLIKRLAQRAGALTATDVAAILWQTWANVALVERTDAWQDVDTTGSTLFIPAMVSGLVEPIVYVASRERIGLVLKTVLTWSMLSDAQRMACARLLEAIHGAEFLGGAYRSSELGPLVAAVTNI